MITEFSLHGFRNHALRQFATDAPIILFTGSNGIGKTNCLEALSFLVAGRGLRHAKMEEILTLKNTASSDNNLGWGVQAKIKSDHKIHKIATGFKPTAKRRHILIDGMAHQSQTSLHQHIQMLWYIPQMARLFQDGRSARLKLLDRIVAMLDEKHYGRLQSYEQQMRERLTILLRHQTEPLTPQLKTWLDTLEHDLALRAISIASSRAQILVRLNHYVIDPPIQGFPALKLELQQQHNFLNAPAAQSENAYQQQLLAHRQQDAQDNRTNFGIHRSDMVMHYYPLVAKGDANAEQAIEMKYCSTGQQKISLLALLLAQLQLLLQEDVAPPILLLDDISAHLDAQHLKLLLDYLQSLQVQLFMTGNEDFLTQFSDDLAGGYLHYPLDF